MNSELLQLAESYGIGATLSIGLIFYILKAQEKRDLRQEDRENNYQEILSKLTDKLNIVQYVKKDVEDIKNYISKN